MKSSCALVASLLFSCASAGPTSGSDAPPISPEVNPYWGGRLFDKWSAITPAKPGAPALERLKNLFGWDLRGTAGHYGAKYANKKGALPVNLLDDRRSTAELRDWLRDGGDGLPAYGEVLGPREFDAIAQFIDAVRSHRLAQPSDVWTLDEKAPNFYRLNAGGDAERGRRYYADACASCHGDDGTLFLFDDGEYTLGSFMRQKAYEGWFKVLVGQPGSSMEEQVPKNLGGVEQGQWILDIAAALCDRAAFPRGTGKADEVADGDLRCGAYLK
ncbi:MAG: hypothetical protein IV100_07760 [Myxococcales bacterium]|nr:hypothetical protein [Myxococcales bacterium]